MNRRILAPTVMLCGMLLFTGCASAGDSNAATKPDTSGSNAAAPEAEASVPADGAFETMTLKAAHVFQESHPIHKGMELFAQRVNENTGGAVTVEIYPNSVLGGENEQLQQLIQGSIDCDMVSGVAMYQGYDARAGIEDLPFLFTSAESAHKALDGEYGVKLAEEVLEPVGTKVINYWENGMRHFTNDVRPIVTPSDMKGIKFRSANSPIRIKMFEACNASVVPMQFSELYTALQQGTVQGQENPIPLIETSNFDGVQKYLSLSGHIYNATVLAFNPDKWNSLSPELQEVIINAANEARDYERELNAKESDDAVERLKSKGMEVNEVDKSAFVEAVQPVWDTFKKENGSELIDLAVSYND